MTAIIERIKEIESETRNIMGTRPDEYFRKNGYQKSMVKRLETLAWERKDLLNSLYNETPLTKDRMLQITEAIYDLKRKMLKRMLKVYRLNILENPDSAFDDDYELSGRIEVGVNYDPDEPTEDNDTVLAMPDDDHYCSDFRYMLPAIRELKCKGASIIDGIGLTNINLKGVNRGQNPTTEEIFGYHYYELDDEKSWSEKLSELKENGVIIKSPLYDFDYWPLSIPDILRINSYDIQVELWLQHSKKLS